MKNISEVLKDIWPSFYPWYSAMMQERMTAPSEDIIAANEEIWLVMEEVLYEEKVKGYTASADFMRYMKRRPGRKIFYR